MKKLSGIGWVGAIAILSALLTQAAEARNSREHYAVVEAQELAQFPQRFWGRGVVFEDTFESIAGGTEQTGGRRYSGIRTRAMGRIFIHPDLSRTIDRMIPGRTYLFAGIVVSETGPRIPFVGARTRYWIAIEEIERLVADADEELAGILADSERDDAAFAPIQRAVRGTQNQLIARARGEGVPIEDLFEVDNPRQDAAMQAARLAVRELANETGVTAAELLSILVRELLAREYSLPQQRDENPAPQPETAPPSIQSPVRRAPPAAVPDITPAPISAPALDSPDEDSVESEIEPQRQRRFLFFRSRSSAD